MQYHRLKPFFLVRTPSYIGSAYISYVFHVSLKKKRRTPGLSGSVRVCNETVLFNACTDSQLFFVSLVSLRLVTRIVLSCHLSNGEMTDAQGESHLRTIVGAEIISGTKCGPTREEENTECIRVEMENGMFFECTQVHAFVFQFQRV